MRSYDYAKREGIEEISWNRFADLSRQLTEELAGLGIDLIVGIARAGLFPATAVASALQCELFPVRVTRRVNGLVQYSSPVWRVDVPGTVAGQKVAVIDEIADSGETLALVGTRALERNARQVWTVSLVTHSWADPQPDITALTSDALIVFPWDKCVYMDGEWRAHPEIEAAIRSQENPSPNG